MKEAIKDKRKQTLLSATNHIFIPDE